MKQEEEQEKEVAGHADERHEVHDGDSDFMPPPSPALLAKALPSSATLNALSRLGSYADMSVLQQHLATPSSPLAGRHPRGVDATGKAMAMVSRREKDEDVDGVEGREGEGDGVWIFIPERGGSVLVDRVREALSLDGEEGEDEDEDEAGDGLEIRDAVCMGSGEFSVEDIEGVAALVRRGREEREAEHDFEVTGHVYRIPASALQTGGTSEAEIEQKMLELYWNTGHVKRAVEEFDVRLKNAARHPGRGNRLEDATVRAKVVVCERPADAGSHVL
ncbi:hypothetical protein BDV95DRAFT_35761 [Massariosphaeria phaeospora]|uniref:Uncharacterized protein n=1 Tax=Massariosphaeria phaeospora TaxID=100035 RepID=A0A7C8I6P9_9PLEO|nr:hypothetical protein BDV95DRAFT_35761 [Massariosphaeria phaeospora]